MDEMKTNSSALSSVSHLGRLNEMHHFRKSNGAAEQLPTVAGLRVSSIKEQFSLGSQCLATDCHVFSPRIEPNCAL